MSSDRYTEGLCDCKVKCGPWLPNTAALHKCTICTTQRDGNQELNRRNYRESILKDITMENPGISWFSRSHYVWKLYWWMVEFSQKWLLMCISIRASDVPARGFWQHPTRRIFICGMSNASDGWMSSIADEYANWNQFCHSTRRFPWQ